MNLLWEAEEGRGSARATRSNSIRRDRVAIYNVRLDYASIRFSVGKGGLKRAGGMLGHARDGFWKCVHLCGIKLFRCLFFQAPRINRVFSAASATQQQPHECAFEY